MSLAKLILMGGPVGVIFALLIVALMTLVVFFFFGIFVMIGTLLLLIGLFIEISSTGQAKEGHIMILIGTILLCFAFFF